MLEKIHITVALFAALAITILSLYQDVTFYELSKRLIIVIPVFFIMGLFFRNYLKKLFEPPPIEPDVNNTENEEPKEEAGEEVDGTGDLYDDDIDLD